jgi:hypothetical protein
MSYYRFWSEVVVAYFKVKTWARSEVNVAYFKVLF